MSFITPYLFGLFLEHRFLIIVLYLIGFVIPAPFICSFIVFQKKQEMQHDMWHLVSIILILFWSLIYFPYSLLIGCYVAISLFPALIPHYRLFFINHQACFIIYLVFTFILNVFVGLLATAIFLYSIGFNDHNLIWYPRHKLELISHSLAVDGQLPQTQNELVTRYPNIQELNKYGYWCYYYNQTDNNFYIVAKFKRLWFMFDNSGEVDRSDNIDSAKARGLFHRCAEQSG